MEVSSRDDLPFHDWRESHRVQRGHGVHILLALLGVALALGLFIASSTGFLDFRASMLIVLCLGVLALPLIFMDPVHGLVVYAMMAPISLEFTLGSVEMRVHDPLAVLILVGIILQSIKHARPLPRLRGKRFVLLYAAAGIGLTVLGMILKANGREPNIFHALKIVQYAVIAIAAGLSIRSERDMRLVLGGFLAGLVLLAGQLGYDADHVTGRTTGSAVGEKANVLSVYLAVATGVVLGCVDRVKDKLLIVILIALILVAGNAMLLTKSRSGYAALGVVLFAAAFLMRRKIIPIGVAMAGAVAFVVQPGLLSRLQSLGAVIGIGEDPSFEARKIAYSLIWRQTSRQPQTLLFGEGRGVEDLGYADTQWGIEMLYGGLIGVIVCGLLILGALWLAFQAWKASRYRNDAIGAGSLAGLLGIIAASVATFGLTSWSSIRLAEAVFIMLGVVMAADRLLRYEAQRLGGQIKSGPPLPPISSSESRSESGMVGEAKAARKFDY